MSYLFKYYAKQYDRFMRVFKLDNNNYIIKSLGDISALNILDIGGGTGRLASIMTDLGANVTILDPEVKMTEIAKRRNVNINIINGYSNNTTLKDNSIDLIIMRDTFHHIVEQEETLKECKRVLKLNGKIVIHEFDRKHIIPRLICFFEICCFEKIKMLSADEMMNITKKYFNTYNISKVSSYEYLYIGEKE